MACNASKTPFLSAVAKRGFAQVNARPIGQTAEVKSTVLPNKVVVATAESSLPVTRISVVFRAGSRNETYDTLGANHILRIAAGLSTKYRSGFNVTRNLQQIGGSLTASSDRELVTYTIETTSNQQEVALKLLTDIIQPAFKPWEISDSSARIKTQLAALPPQVRAVELLHKAAYRTGLGNSVYIAKHKVGKLSTESLLHYVQSNFTADRTAVVGVGIDQNILSGFAKTLELGSGGAKPAASKFNSGDIRKEEGGETAYVAVAGQAVISSLQDALAYAVLERILGVQSPIKYGVGNGQLIKAAAAAAEQKPVAVRALSAAYSDGGLFGFVVAADASVAGKVVDAGVKILRAGSVSATDIKRGKASLQAEILETYGTERGLIATIGSQAGLYRTVESAESLVSAIESMPATEIQYAAKKIAGSKLSIGAVGNLSKVPFASDL